MKVEITRESVAMGDDVWAPHKIMIKVPRDALIGHIAIWATDYLAFVTGNVMWTMKSLQPGDEESRGKGLMLLHFTYDPDSRQRTPSFASIGSYRTQLNKISDVLEPHSDGVRRIHFDYHSERGLMSAEELQEQLPPQRSAIKIV
ncbi:hypothetical protein G7068_06335 [Leucobacter viscericola]|uniref:Uncharacterized protein n=1 Tax=Leucobacter viscericola TaxID=2714935 RepID=A0A6G7XEI3_9MICO|nr:hypothetical protein [Leucobacter viscericola]QIK62859.1 hypothetical protein G7068_06335 [Leucobacter viscericola]